MERLKELKYDEKNTISNQKRETPVSAGDHQSIKDEIDGTFADLLSDCSHYPMNIKQESEPDILTEEIPFQETSEGFISKNKSQLSKGEITVSVSNYHFVKNEIEGTFVDSLSEYLDFQNNIKQEPDLDISTEEISFQKTSDILVTATKTNRERSTRDHIKNLKEYVCSVCQKGFNVKRTLRQHMKIHSNIKQLSCKFCAEQFHLKTDLKLHIANHTGEKPYKCTACDKQFFSKYYLAQHISVIHEKFKQFKCEVCDRKFTQKNTLDCHKRIHTGEIPFKCTICDKRFIRKSDFNRHKKTVCKKKPKLETTSSELFILKKTVCSRIDQTIVECDICKKLLQRQTIYNHMKSHSNLREYVCRICKKGFNIKKALRQHMKIHSNIKQFSCQYCANQFHLKVDLQYHIAHHTGEKPYKCTACEKRFIRKHHLILHIVSVHEKLKPYVCEVCDRRFSQKNSLDYHMRTHTGEKPFQCTICDKRFIRQYDLRLHKKAVCENPKDEEKPYKCETCDKQFAWHVSLLSHIRRKHESKTISM